MKTLIIGYGSIGERHARLLQEQGIEISIVSQRELGLKNSFPNLVAAFERFSPDYVVIANKTSDHHKTLLELADLNFRGNVLIEKPLFDVVHPFPKHPFKAVYVAYNLRFHPVLQRLNRLLKNQKILSAQIYAGGYLPDWRNERDYRTTYSAKKSEGGGVLRDLSHELDYATWLLGQWKKVSALGGHWSPLAIDTDDVFTLLMQTERCPAVTIHLNYLDRVPRRQILINTDNGTFAADLTHGALYQNSQMEKFEVSRDETYLYQHKAVIKGEDEFLCSLEEGMETLKLIQAAETANQNSVWVTRC